MAVNRRGLRPSASIVAMALMGLLAACGGGDVTDADAAGNAPEVASEQGPVGADDQGEAAQLLSFTASTVYGDQFEGAGLLRQDIAIWFWAPW
ncbi:MAG: hypothetical protein ABGZ36_20250 [Actinomycetota bacterium]|uniref:hypothetical protein n=1 Tax=Euzebya rosea TaxID=2052804 RepID=UPI0013005928|nr:hypothetical protein [Euzebya rosea]